MGDKLAPTNNTKVYSANAVPRSFSLDLPDIEAIKLGIINADIADITHSSRILKSEYSKK